MLNIHTHKAIEVGSCTPDPGDKLDAESGKTVPSIPSVATSVLEMRLDSTVIPQPSDRIQSPSLIVIIYPS